MSKEDVEKANLCPKCLARSDSAWHADKGCSEHARKFICKKHDLHWGVCKCEKPKTTVQHRTMAMKVSKPKLQQVFNTLPKGNFFDRTILFYSEIAHLQSKTGKYIPVCINYDSYATDSSIHESLKEHLKDLHDEGDVEVHQYGLSLIHI